MFPQRQKWVWTSGAAILIAAWVPNFNHQAPWDILDHPWPSCTVVLESAECRRRSDLWLPSAMEFWFCDSFNKYLLSTCYFPGTTGMAWTPNQSEHREDCIMAVKSCHSHFIPSVQFSPSVMSNALWPHGLQQARLPCPSPTHVHRVCDAIQPSHPLSPPVFNLSQHQGLFQWVSSLHQVAKVLEFQLQHQSFQWIFSSGHRNGKGQFSLQSQRKAMPKNIPSSGHCYTNLTTFKFFNYHFYWFFMFI